MRMHLYEMCFSFCADFYEHIYTFPCCIVYYCYSQIFVVKFLFGRADRKFNHY